jgi:deoxyribodipyrimidine photolyase-related protein
MASEDRRLILVLGDQLSEGLSALRDARAGDVVLMAEVMAEATYAGHHKKKLALVFSAMRHFAEVLRDAGYQVDYRKLGDTGDEGSLETELALALKRHAAKAVLVTEPGEYRLQKAMDGWEKRLGAPVEIRADDRFICSKEDFAVWAEGRKRFRMEDFYREMRRRTGLLMDGDEPEGGRWNFDAENRKPPKKGLAFPERPRFEPDAITEEVLELVEARFADNFGDLRPFGFPVTKKQAEAALAHFLKEALPFFGDYQDAMLREEKFLYHSLLSPAINLGLLDPLEACRRAEAEYGAGRAPLNAVEGFIRQILGWREYVRGLYWLKMPGYLEENFFGHDRDLPWFYWSGETEMACLAAAIGQTREEAYAHHIQRLMLTGNFALLAGVEPKQVHDWYLAVYADAYEWVELPNTLGMSQFADGGLLGSKPYVSGGNYIAKMSDYCEGCAYDVKTKTGEGACPFNLLYWDFLARHRDKLDGNRRLTTVYATWDRMDDARKKTIRKEAQAFLDSLS